MKNTYKNISLLVVCLSMLLYIKSTAQPASGDWFREYNWVTPDIEGNENFLRVGGNFDYRKNVPKFPKNAYKEGDILLTENVDLSGAIRAEVMIEKNLCHDYTTGLSISWNNNDYLVFPEAEGIPEPQESYLYHNYPVAEVPLSDLKDGENNYFSFKVDTFQHWNWPQNLVYGLTLRVYYYLEKMDLPKVSLDIEGKSENPDLSIDYKALNNIEQVDYLAFYTGPDMNGDGIYTEWHCNWVKTELRNHIGSSQVIPFTVNWNTSWIPEQNQAIKIAARVKFKDSKLIYFTETNNDFKLERNYSVKFYQPYNIPHTWTTRNGEFSNSFYFNEDKTAIDSIMVVWRSWSPGYMNGMYLNDELFFIREGRRYAYDEHQVFITDENLINLLNKGQNFIKTGKTPEHNWQMVHGMDVFYPGPMVLIKFKSNKK